MMGVCPRPGMALGPVPKAYRLPLMTPGLGDGKCQLYRPDALGTSGSCR